jgi:histidyl-tRNA synthetase
MVQKLLAQLADAPVVLDFLCQDCHRHFKRVKDLLDELRLPYAVNPRMVRGLDYYTRTAFEVVAGNLGAQNAVCGGGRYDGLAEEIGGPSIPAIGFAIGFDRLVMLLPEEKNFLRYADVFLAALGEDAQRKGFTLAQELRDEGVWVEIDYGGKSLKSQMRKADRFKTPWVVILGEEELKKNLCVSDLVAGSQKLPEVVHVEEVALACLSEGLDLIKKRIGEHGLNRIVIAGCSHREIRGAMEEMAKGMMEAISIDISENRSVTFYHVYQNHLWLSPHPEDSIEARWGLKEM